jgi:hypothetical protein
MEEKKEKVAIEVCEEDFERFLESMDLKDKTESTRLDDEDKKSLVEVKHTIIDAIRKGSLVIDDKGQPVFRPQVGAGEAITFYEPTGAQLMEMDRIKAGHSVARQNALMGAITKTSPGRFASMALRDYRVCQAITSLFLA